MTITTRTQRAAILILLAVIGAVALTVAFKTPSASSQEAGGAYVTVAWRMPETDWPQTYVTSVETGQPALNVLDTLLTDCGRYQIDVYTNDDQAKALIARGVLTSPADDADVYLQHKYLVVTECEPATTTTTAPSYVPEVPPASSVQLTPAFTG